MQRGVLVRVSDALELVRDIQHLLCSLLKILIHSGRGDQHAEGKPRSDLRWLEKSVLTRERNLALRTVLVLHDEQIKNMTFKCKAMMEERIGMRRRCRSFSGIDFRE